MRNMTKYITTFFTTGGGKLFTWKHVPRAYKPGELRPTTLLMNEIEYQDILRFGQGEKKLNIQFPEWSYTPAAILMDKPLTAAPGGYNGKLQEEQT